MAAFGVELTNGGGTRFGDVRVSVDAAGGSCMVVCDRIGFQARRMSLHSLDEILGACAEQRVRSHSDPLAADIVRALSFAVQCIQQHSSRHYRRGRP